MEEDGGGLVCGGFGPLMTPLFNGCMMEHGRWTHSTITQSIKMSIISLHRSLLGIARPPILYEYAHSRKQCLSFDQIWIAFWTKVRSVHLYRPYKGDGNDSLFQFKLAIPSILSLKCRKCHIFSCRWRTTQVITVKQGTASRIENSHVFGAFAIFQ